MGLELQGWIESESDTAMRDVVFQVLSERQGHLEARAMELPLGIAAASLEELQHEAREALIDHFGPAHCAYRVRIRRQLQPLLTRSVNVRCPSAACS
jgi:hypothetical protein